MKITVNLTQNEFTKLTLLMLLKRLQIVFLLTLFVLVFLITGTLAFWSKDISLLYLSACSFLLILIVFYGIRSNARKYYQQNKAVGDAIVYDISSHQISLQKGDYKKTIAWKNILRLNKKLGMLLFWENKLVVHVIPIRSLTENQYQELVQIAQSNNIPNQL